MSQQPQIIFVSTPVQPTVINNNNNNNNNLQQTTQVVNTSKYARLDVESQEKDRGGSAACMYCCCATMYICCACFAIVMIIGMIGGTRYKQ